MAGFITHFYYYQVGSPDFIHSFFSTVAYRLEGNKWGARFPCLMNEFYMGELSAENVSKALNELDIIGQELKKLPPDAIIWDIEDLTKRPPWGDDISADITDMSNYYVTSDGQDFLTVFLHALQTAEKLNKPLKITTM